MLRLAFLLLSANLCAQDVAINLLKPLDVTKHKDSYIYGKAADIDAELVGQYRSDIVKDDVRVIRIAWVALRNKKGRIAALAKPVAMEFTARGKVIDTDTTLESDDEDNELVQAYERLKSGKRLEREGVTTVASSGDAAGELRVDNPSNAAANSLTTLEAPQHKRAKITYAADSANSHRTDNSSRGNSGNTNYSNAHHPSSGRSSLPLNFTPATAQPSENNRSESKEDSQPAKSDDDGKSKTTETSYRISPEVRIAEEEGKVYVQHRKVTIEDGEELIGDLEDSGYSYEICRQYDHEDCRDVIDYNLGKHGTAFATYRKYYIDNQGEKKYLNAVLYENRSNGMALYYDSAGLRPDIDLSANKATPRVNLVYVDRNKIKKIVRKEFVPADVEALDIVYETVDFEHDYEAGESYELQRGIITLGDNVIEVKSSHRSGNVFVHQFDTKGYTTEINADTKRVIPMGRRYIVVAGKDKYIRDYAEPIDELNLEFEINADGKFDHRWVEGKSYPLGRYYYRNRAGRIVYVGSECIRKEGCVHQYQECGFAHDDELKQSYKMQNISVELNSQRYDIATNKLRDDLPAISYTRKNIALVDSKDRSTYAEGDYWYVPQDRCQVWERPALDGEDANYYYEILSAAEDKKSEDRISKDHNIQYEPILDKTVLNHDTGIASIVALKYVMLEDKKHYISEVPEAIEGREYKFLVERFEPDYVSSTARVIGRYYIAGATGDRVFVADSNREYYKALPITLTTHAWDEEEGTIDVVGYSVPIQEVTVVLPTSDSSRIVVNDLVIKNDYRNEAAKVAHTPVSDEKVPNEEGEVSYENGTEIIPMVRRVIRRTADGKELPFTKEIAPTLQAVEDIKFAIDETRAIHADYVEGKAYPFGQYYFVRDGKTIKVGDPCRSKEGYALDYKLTSYKHDDANKKSYPIHRVTAVISTTPADIKEYEIESAKIREDLAVNYTSAGTRVVADEAAKYPENEYWMIPQKEYAVYLRPTVDDSTGGAADEYLVFKQNLVVKSGERLAASLVEAEYVDYDNVSFNPAIGEAVLSGYRYVTLADGTRHPLNEQQPLHKVELKFRPADKSTFKPDLVAGTVTIYGTYYITHGMMTKDVSSVVAYHEKLPLEVVEKGWHDVFAQTMDDESISYRIEDYYVTFLGKRYLLLEHHINRNKVKRHEVTDNVFSPAGRVVGDSVYSTPQVRRRLFVSPSGATSTQTKDLPAIEQNVHIEYDYARTRLINGNREAEIYGRRYRLVDGNKDYLDDTLQIKAKSPVQFAKSRFSEVASRKVAVYGVYKVYHEGKWHAIGGEVKHSDIAVEVVNTRWEDHPSTAVDTPGYAIPYETYKVWWDGKFIPLPNEYRIEDRRVDHTKVSDATTPDETQAQEINGAEEVPLTRTVVWSSPSKRRLEPATKPAGIEKRPLGIDYEFMQAKLNTRDSTAELYGYRYKVVQGKKQRVSRSLERVGTASLQFEHKKFVPTADNKRTKVQGVYYVVMPDGRKDITKIVDYHTEIPMKVTIVGWDDHFSDVITKPGHSFPKEQHTVMFAGTEHVLRASYVNQAKKVMHKQVSDQVIAKPGTTPTMEGVFEVTTQIRRVIFEHPVTKVRKPVDLPHDSKLVDKSTRHVEVRKWRGFKLLYSDRSDPHVDSLKSDHSTDEIANKPDRDWVFKGREWYKAFGLDKHGKGGLGVQECNVRLLYRRYEQRVTVIKLGSRVLSEIPEQVKVGKWTLQRRLG